jgi:hypothetical protein
MYRKRIGNVVFFPGVERLTPPRRSSSASDARATRSLELKLRRLYVLRPATIEVIERLAEDLLADLNAPASGGAA